MICPAPATNRLYLGNKYLRLFFSKEGKTDDRQNTATSHYLGQPPTSKSTLEPLQRTQHSAPSDSHLHLITIATRHYHHTKRQQSLHTRHHTAQGAYIDDHNPRMLALGAWNDGLRTMIET